MGLTESRDGRVVSVGAQQRGRMILYGAESVRSRALAWCCTTCEVCGACLVLLVGVGVCVCIARLSLAFQRLHTRLWSMSRLQNASTFSRVPLPFPECLYLSPSPFV